MLRYRCMCLLWLLGLLVGAALFVSPSSLQADTTQPLQQARSTFKQFEFAKAAKLLQTLLKSQKLSSSQQAEAYLLLGMCQYNQAQFPAAKQSFRQALRRNLTIQLPPGQSPAVVKQFEKLRVEEKQRSAQKPPKTQMQSRPVERKTTTQQPPTRKRVAARPNRRPAPEVRKPAQRRSHPKVARKEAAGSLTKRSRPPSFAQQHTLSLTLMIAGSVVMLAGAGVGIGYQLQNNSLQSLGQNPQSTGLDVSQAYQQALTTGVTSTVLLSAGGVFAGTGLSLLLYKSLKRKPKTPPPTAPTTQGRNLILDSHAAAKGPQP
ncbi:MAG: hypothetical protein EP343_05105 [Deltaproteobacteria bacterium]|nr:MAG: hypothetical protein EP343_05105 [Deltaproteobacteria bacterium]